MRCGPGRSRPSSCRPRTGRSSSSSRASSTRSATRARPASASTSSAGVALRVGIVGLELREDDALQCADPCGRPGHGLCGRRPETESRDGGDRRRPPRPARRGHRLEEDAGRDPNRRRGRPRGDPRRASSGRCAPRRARRLLRRGRSRRRPRVARLELIVADREHVDRRLERVRKEAKSGDRAKRQEPSSPSGCSRTSTRAPLGVDGRAAVGARAADDEAAHPARERRTGSTARSRWSSRSSPTTRPRSFAPARRPSTTSSFA